MIKINNEIYRNIQEQVQANKDAIEAFTNVEFTLNNMGIRVLGKVKQPSDIPIGTREFGDAYLVGISAPYDIWIYTRTLTPGLDGVFINMGPLTIIGPQGAPGEPGSEGPAGKDGYAPVIRYGAGAPILQPTDKNGYIYVDTNNSNLYTFDDGWKFVVSTRGPAGPQGPQGIQGATGTTLSIVGKLASESLLPTDFASGNILKNTAYLVTKSGGTHLYIIMGNQNDYSTWYWQDAGDFNLGSVIYKNNEFQYSVDVVDTYNTSTGAVVTDIAANKLYNDLNNKINTNIDNIASNTNQIGALNSNFTELNTYAREKLELHDNQIQNAQTQISDLDGEIINTNTNIGDLASLATDDKSSIVAAVNELHTDITNTNTNLSAESTKVGDLANLATDDKTNIVAAINEVKNSAGGLAIKSKTYSNITLDTLYRRIIDDLVVNNNRNLIKIRLNYGPIEFPSSKNFKININITDGSMSTAAYTTDSYLVSSFRGVDFYIDGAELWWKNVGGNYEIAYDYGRALSLKGVLNGNTASLMLNTTGSKFNVDERIFYNSSTSVLTIYPKLSILSDSFGY